MKTLLTIALKDIRVIVRDKSAALIMLAMPLGLIFILGSALGGIEESEAIDADVAIVNEDAGATGELFVEGLAESEEITALFNIDTGLTADEARTAVERGDLTAAVIIPERLTESIESGESVSLEVLQDPGSQITAGIWAGIVRAAVASASAQIIAGETIAEALVPPGGEVAPPGMPTPPAPEKQGAASESQTPAVTVRQVEAETGTRIPMISYYAAGMSGMFLLFGGMFGAFAFIKERREQTLARLMASPVVKAVVIGGKALGIFSVAAAQFLVLLVGTTLLFRVDWGTNVLATVLIGLAEAATAAGLAMTLTALGKTERAVGGIGPAVIMLFAALGGSMIPAEMLPSWMRPLQSVSPVYWAVDGFLDVMLGAGVADVLPHVGALLVIAAVTLGFGIWRVSYE